MTQSFVWVYCRLTFEILSILICIFSAITTSILIRAFTLGFPLKSYRHPDNHVSSVLMLESIPKSKHLEIISLLIMHTMAMEILPLALNHIVSQTTTILLSFTLVFLGGEIFPDLLVSSESRAQRIFACFQPLLFIAVVLFFPIAYPLSVLLENIKSRLHSQQTCEKIDVDCESNNEAMVEKALILNPNPNNIPCDVSSNRDGDLLERSVTKLKGILQHHQRNIILNPN